MYHAFFRFRFWGPFFLEMGVATTRVPKVLGPKTKLKSWLWTTLFSWNRIFKFLKALTHSPSLILIGLILSYLWLLVNAERYYLYYNVAVNIVYWIGIHCSNTSAFKPLHDDNQWGLTGNSWITPYYDLKYIQFSDNIIFHIELLCKGQ